MQFADSFKLGQALLRIRMSCPAYDSAFENNDYSRTQTNSECLSRAKTRTGKHKSALVIIDKIATYFRLPEDLTSRAKHILQIHSEDLSNRTPIETALFVTYLAARDWVSPWSIDDFIENFPIPVDKSVIKHINFIFVEKSSLYKTLQFEVLQDEPDRFLNTIMPGLEKQFGGSSKIPKSTAIQLKKRTKALINLGDMYGLNTGRKCRPTIIATALIAYVSLLIQSKPGKYKPKSSKKISLYHNRQFECFKKYCVFGTKLLQSRLYDYMEFLKACALNITWISQPDKKYVHYFLQDILDLYSPQNGATPLLKLTHEQYSINVVKKNAASSRKFEALVDSAQQHIDNNSTPIDNQSLEYSIFYLMSFGVAKDDILKWSERAIRGITDSLQFRSNYGTHATHRLDSDRVELDENDMLDQEVGVYIHSA
ncbi:hypothetical protein [Parasitella parasitica]|uniref:Uncharacterized protein n=1 Tax=Parasitella parasitica TaxID=35722 RepID=A0A0B7N9K5_9FUNG|nr:hypothetical protein [Parasitella parasitica]